ncbi:hypothetical protein MCOR25_007438 [Pyricularia grisea]|nr:hypothetical protein MCOR25_007438 [Pyricularia grisea]
MASTACISEFRNAQNLRAHSLDLARWAPTWTVYARLSSELKEALYPDDGWDLEDHNMQRLDHALIVVCCGLLEKSTNDRFQFIHLTALDFAQRASTHTKVHT